MRVAAVGIALVLVAIARGCSAQAPKSSARGASAIALPGGEGGIGFDDLGYSRTLGQVLVPGGRTGRLYLVDAATSRVEWIPGFSTVQEFTGGHDDGITSVAEGAGRLFVTDRTTLELALVNPARRSSGDRGPLGSTPDYVRWLEPAHELWVTEPDTERIEIFRLDEGEFPRTVQIATISVPGGPESLVFDLKRGRAYTHGATGTAAIDVKSRTMVATWNNGCEDPRGIALDAVRGFLFVACSEGAVHVLNVETGTVVGNAALGGGIDIIAYDPELEHLYVPSRDTKTLAILAVSAQGALAVLGTFPGTADSHCVAAAGRVWFCDPPHGRLLTIADPYPPSGR
jgi:hypothetical protein